MYLSDRNINLFIGQLFYKLTNKNESEVSVLLDGMLRFLY
jgi:hypothetical protein